MIVVKDANRILSSRYVAIDVNTHSDMHCD